MGGMLFINRSTETTLKEIDSPKLTPVPIEQVVKPTLLPEPIIPVKPSVLPEEPKEELIVSSLKPVEEIVLEVIRGNWGNGLERKEALEKEGYDYAYVQKLVTKVKDENVLVNQLRPIEEILMEVINGKWGEAEEAEIRLTKVGFDYQVIQSLIDEMVVTSTVDTPQK